jgi:glycosyltransferase involved in cell wall biosynthesis
MGETEISAVVNTLNDETRIEACLRSLAWADEIVVVDMESGDRTVEIARRFTDRVFSHERRPYVEAARNFGISRATHDWVFILDPDERCTNTLAATVRRIVRDEGDRIAGIAYPSMTIMFGRWMRHGGWWPAHQVRVFRKDKARYSGEIHAFPAIDGPMRRLPPLPENSIVHISYQSIADFVERMNRYTDVEAEQRRARGRRFGLVRLLGAPVWVFFRRYVRQQGFRDGTRGLLLSLLMAVYYFLVYAKLWDSGRDRSAEFSPAEHGIEI